MPRPDTETVVELALELLRAGGNLDRPLRIADLGTGSGAILLALLSELPAAQGFGTDISEGALQTAGANAARAGLSDRATFIACDYASGLSGPFDLIVSNPPYIRSADIDGLAAEVQESRSPGRARWRRRRAGRLPRADSPGGWPSGAGRPPLSWRPEKAKAAQSRL